MPPAPRRGLGTPIAIVPANLSGFGINAGPNDASCKPATDRQGFLTPVQRITPDNVALCEELAAQLQMPDTVAMTRLICG